MLERSFHFIPAHRPELFQRTEEIGADAYVFDLEDAVAGSEKERGVRNLDQWLSAGNGRASVHVRVNGPEHPLASRERDLIARHPSLGVVLPKVDSAGGLRDVLSWYEVGEGRAVIAIIESVRGVAEVAAIVDTGLLTGVGLGLEDLLSDFVFDRSQLAFFIAQARYEIALRAMAAGLRAIDTVSLDLDGGDALQRDIAEARSSGMTAKFSIHPRQVAPINLGFGPSPENVERSRWICEQTADFPRDAGYLRLSGRIISPPTVRKAQHIRRVSEDYERRS